MPRRALGYVAGPGRTDVAGAITLINTGDNASNATLVAYDADGGAELGQWISESLAPFATVSVKVADILNDAVPAIGSDPAAITISLEPPAGGVSLSYLESVVGGEVNDLTAGCVLKGGGADDDEDEDDEEVSED